MPPISMTQRHNQRPWQVPEGWRTAIFLWAGTALAAGMLGYGAGTLLHVRDSVVAHSAGACIALEMASAHGAVDAQEKRMILRSLASAINPHFGRFPERASDIATACETLLGAGRRRTAGHAASN